MFRIPNDAELSRQDRKLQEARDKVFAWRLARSLAQRANASDGYKPTCPQVLPKLARFVVEPVSTRQRLFKARRAGVRRSHTVRVVDPDNVLRF